MNRKIFVSELIAVIGIGLIFTALGPLNGWRGIGLLQLYFSINVIRSKKVNYGWEGFEPAGQITGHPAIVIGLLSVAIAVMLIFFPAQTIMKLAP